MKKTLLLFLAAALGAAASAQTTLYTETFNSGAGTWQLNTSDLSGTTTLTPNYWIINNAYAGGDLFGGLISIPDVPNEPAAVTGNPQSNYLHILSVQGANNGINNANYNATGTKNYFAYMGSSINTTGYTGVSLSFWWLCDGSNGSYGEVYYRTSSGGAWMQLTAPLAKYNTTTNWTQQTIANAAFDNQAYLEFGFRFHHNNTGNDPPFSVDELKVTGNPSVTPPVVAISVDPDTTCQNTCITFTANVMGTADSFHWNVPGATFTDTNASMLTACFPNAGSFTAYVYAYNAGGMDSASLPVFVNATPTPTIAQAGNQITGPAGYAGYTWLLNGAPVSGATSGVITPASSGSYQLQVTDSNGCTGLSNVLSFTVATGIGTVAGNSEGIWMNERESMLHSDAPLTENRFVSITDASGRVVARMPWGKGGSTLRLNDIGLQAGLYVIRISTARQQPVMLKWLRP